jgi:hypothetical protein
MKREDINALRHQGQLQDILSQLDRINRKIKENIEGAWQDDLEDLIDDIKHKIEKS